MKSLLLGQLSNEEQAIRYVLARRMK